MTTANLKRLMALLFAFALVAAACGGSDSEGADAEGDSSAESEGSDEGGDLGGVDEDAAADALEQASEEDADEETVASGSVEELEIQWAEERAAIVASLQEGGYGLSEDGTTLTGPGGWEVDMTACPADWSNTAGVADGTVTVGLTIPQSGTLAAYGNIGTGMEAYFNYVNEHGGVGPDGLQIALETRDDAYDPNLTTEYVEEFLGGDEPFYVQSLGTPNTFAVRDTLNAACVPHPMAMTGHPAWADPINFPWTTGLQLNYFTEGVLWAGWIEQNLADEAPVTVAALVADNDFGLAYEKGFLAAAEGSDVIGDVEVVRHDVAAATLTNEVTTLAAADPGVFIAMTAGTPCTVAFQEAARAGIVESASAVWAPSVCANANFLGPAEGAADGWLSLGGGLKDTADESLREDDVYLAFLAEELEAAGLDPEVALLGSGFGQFGWPQVQSMMIAAELDGGLTRTNYMLALRALDMTHPALLPGIAFAQNGAEDGYLVEGTQVQRWDAENQTNVQEGGVIDLDGSSGTCVWDTEAGC
ncbi:MAG: ABC transporter substrate-binding protein [Acidimicrobiales bacterium]